MQLFSLLNHRPKHQESLAQIAGDKGDRDVYNCPLEHHTYHTFCYSTCQVVEYQT